MTKTKLIEKFLESYEKPDGFVAEPIAIAYEAYCKGGERVAYWLFERVYNNYKRPVGIMNKLDFINLVTDYAIDDLGRRVLTLGPTHEVDLGGTPTDIRTAVWTYYKDAQAEQWTFGGYRSAFGVVRLGLGGGIAAAATVAGRGCGDEGAKGTTEVEAYAAAGVGWLAERKDG